MQNRKAQAWQTGFWSSTLSTPSVHQPLAAPPDAAAQPHSAMVCRKIAQGLSRAVDTLGTHSRLQCARTARRSLQPPTSRCISTTVPRPAEIETEAQEPFTAAKPFDFEAGDGEGRKGGQVMLRTLRVVPASPSYFSAKPTSSRSPHSSEKSLPCRQYRTLRRRRSRGRLLSSTAS
jgi:hypothetical protein